MGEHQLPLRRHARAHRDVLLADEAQRLGRRPRLAGEHDRGAVRELVPHAGHVADVGEGEDDEPAVARLGELAHVPRDRGHADRGRRPRPSARRWCRSSTRCTRGRSAAIAGEPSRERRPAERGAELGDVEHLARRRHRRGSRRRRRGRSRRGSGAVEDARLLVDAEPQVDRGGDGAGPQRAEVAGGELDRGPEHQADDVAGPHAEVEQRGGEPVGGPVEPGVGDALLAVDVGLAVGVLDAPRPAAGRRSFAALTTADITGRVRTVPEPRGSATSDGVRCERRRDDPVPALALGLVQERVGAPFEDVRGLARAPGADPGGERDRTRYRGTEAFEHRDRLGLGAAGEDDRELVATEPGQRVRRPQLGAPGLGQAHEDVVRSVVADAVVAALEVIDVEDREHDAEVLAGGGARAAARDPPRGRDGSRGR